MKTSNLRISGVITVIAGIFAASVIAAVVAHLIGVDFPWQALLYLSAVGVCMALGIALAACWLLFFWQRYRHQTGHAKTSKMPRQLSVSR